MEIIFNDLSVITSYVFIYSNSWHVCNVYHIITINSCVIHILWKDRGVCTEIISNLAAVLELVSKELNHTAAILQVYAGIWI